MLFDKRTITTKRNHRYYGPTESKKMAVALDQIYVDLGSIYGYFNEQNIEFEALASGYITGVGKIILAENDIKDLEYSLEKTIYIQATQEPIF